MTPGRFCQARDLPKTIKFPPERIGLDGRPNAGPPRLFARMLDLEGVRLPGDRRRAARQTTPDQGLEIPATLHHTIIELIG